MILMSGLFLFSQALMAGSTRPRIHNNIMSLCAHMGKGYHTCPLPYRKGLLVPSTLCAFLSAV